MSISKSFGIKLGPLCKQSFKDKLHSLDLAEPSYITLTFVVHLSVLTTGRCGKYCTGLFDLLLLGTLSKIPFSSCS